MRVVALDRPDDFAGWRETARALLAAGVAPDEVVWRESGATGDLFSGGEAEWSPPPANEAQTSAVRAPRGFIALAETAALHCDPERFAALYRLLWRLQRTPHLLEDDADPLVRHVTRLAAVVRREIHKMRAFIRFRLVDADAAEPHYVAWFEPDHHILRVNARFFVNRFANMRWSILTPRGALHWDGAILREGPPAARGDAPPSDATETLWRSFYASIFNPSRLKIGAMLKEMPRRYWKNLPEAELIPGLIASAQARETAMLSAGGDAFADLDQPTTLNALAEGVSLCRRCPIGCNGTRAVAGEGVEAARLMIVGEQPGDQEERIGRPFVGPAGQLLDQRLAAAGIRREHAWVTNAVKHFKFEEEPRGKARIHRTPNAGEIDRCRWWLSAERALVKPQYMLALGVSAARALGGKSTALQNVRGRPITLVGGDVLWVTAHPSSLLRLSGAAKETAERQFAADLAGFARFMAREKEAR